ncbi:host attachment protein [Croceicoccus marinus]|jgi:protein required for attachment to host cells|uniref:Host attachment protein n=1 Tax=Croceicoccus marinus TaxID=450378 RepID=A0A7G6VVT0_9SPHN|nr:host attachment protein [Croceicoccus marinus]QNE05845.1 host attachment protein [Croceicoccus marinus]
MRLPHKAHLAIVDGERFMLMINDGSPDEPSLREVASPDLDGQNYSAGVRHQDEVGQRHGRTDLEELAHAAAAAEWLNRAALDKMFDRLAIVADPKSLGEMRRHYHKALEEVLIAEEAKTVGGESLSRIESKLLSA